MNRKLGFISAIIVTITVLLFAFAMLIGNNPLSYLVCIFLSWGYVLLCAAFVTQVAEDRKALGYGGLAFAVLYAVFVNFVYYSQLTTIAQMAASTEILSVLDFQNFGSLSFNFDLYGYGMMALSTLLVGLALQPQAHAQKWLKGLMMAHGVFAVSSILLPMLGIFNANMQGGDNIGTYALMFWCAYFTPIGILSALYFKRR